MLSLRSSASRSAARLCFHRVESYNAIFGGDGLEVRRTARSKRKLAAKPQATAFLRVQTSDSTKDSIEIKLPSGISILVPVSAVESIAAILEQVA